MLCYARLCDLITNWNEKREKENLPETLEMLDLLLKWELLSDLSKRIARGKGRRWGFDDVSYHPPFVQSGSL